MSGGRRAACFDTVQAGETDYWFSLKKEDIATAKSICGSCPVLAECRKRSVDLDPPPSSGVWAGMDLRELARVRSRERGSVCEGCGRVYKAVRWSQRFCNKVCSNRYNSLSRYSFDGNGDVSSSTSNIWNDVLASDKKEFG